MTRDALIRNVALRMDEITPDEGYTIPVDGSDNNPLYALIDGIVDDVVLELFTVAPFWRLPVTEFSTPTSETVFSGDYARTIIKLPVPDAFLRVAEIGYEDFQRPITELAVEQSPEGRRQHNRYLVAKEAKPVGVMSFSSTGREIDCYSIEEDAFDATKLTATYIAKPAEIDSSAATTDAVEAVVPSVLIPALEWLTAARAFGARGDANHSAICQQTAQNLLT